MGEFLQVCELPDLPEVRCVARDRLLRQLGDLPVWLGAMIAQDKPLKTAQNAGSTGAPGTLRKVLGGRQSREQAGTSSLSPVSQHFFRNQLYNSEYRVRLESGGARESARFCTLP